MVTEKQMEKLRKVSEEPEFLALAKKVEKEYRAGFNIIIEKIALKFGITKSGASRRINIYAMEDSENPVVVKTAELWDKLLMQWQAKIEKKYGVSIHHEESYVEVRPEGYHDYYGL